MFATFGAVIVLSLAGFGNDEAGAYALAFGLGAFIGIPLQAIVGDRVLGYAVRAITDEARRVDALLDRMTAIEKRRGRPGPNRSDVHERPPFWYWPIAFAAVMSAVVAMIGWLVGTGMIAVQVLAPAGGLGVSEWILPAVLIDSAIVAAAYLVFLAPLWVVRLLVGIADDRWEAKDAEYRDEVASRLAWFRPSAPASRNRQSRNRPSRYTVVQMLSLWPRALPFLSHVRAA
jgi:hypothetical protein